jgi:hypothetical protein
MLFSPILYSSMSHLYFSDIKYFARFLIANTSSQLFYLKMLRCIRNNANRNHVILDANNCIVVL